MQTQNDSKKFFIIQLSIAALILIIFLADRLFYQVYDWVYYQHVIIGASSIVLSSALLTYKKIVSPRLGFELTIAVLYAYPAIFMYQFDFSYVFAFMQTFLFIAVIYPGNLTRFLLILSCGIAISSYVVLKMPEPQLVRDGQSLKPFLLNVLHISGIVALMIFWFFNRQKSVIDRLNKRFISIGRETAFLFHELKSPLARLLTKVEDKELIDASQIRQIIQGVEFVIAETKPVMNSPLKLDGVEEFVNHHFKELCEMNDIEIHFNIKSFVGKGHRESIFLVIRNLVRNAIEASLDMDENRQVWLDIREDTIEVRNRVSPKPRTLNKNKLNDEHKNLGLGLHFVEAVANAHGAKFQGSKTKELVTYQLVLPV